MYGLDGDGKSGGDAEYIRDEDEMLLPDVEATEVGNASLECALMILKYSLAL